jgi:hypothetical protein
MRRKLDNVITNVYTFIEVLQLPQPQLQHFGKAIKLM